MSNVINLFANKADKTTTNITLEKAMLKQVLLNIGLYEQRIRCSNNANDVAKHTMELVCRLQDAILYHESIGVIKRESEA